MSESRREPRRAGRRAAGLLHAMRHTTSEVALRGYYADEGRRLGSVWVDIPAMVANTPLMNEGTGYPTQKPEKLLERLIVATTKEGDTVGDFMCGSGTTLAVAHKLGRSFIGGDMGALAIEITRRRLEALGAAITATA